MAIPKVTSQIPRPQFRLVGIFKNFGQHLGRGLFGSPKPRPIVTKVK